MGPPINPVRFIGLCTPFWVIGAAFDIQLFPGFKLFQAGLAMPMIASLLLTYHERGWTGTAALLRRTCDIASIRPRTWFLPILFLYPSFGFINFLILRWAGADIPVRPTSEGMQQPRRRRVSAGKSNLPT